MLVVETISDGAKMAQQFPYALQNALSGIKYRAILARLPLISSLIPRSMLSISLLFVFLTKNSESP